MKRLISACTLAAMAMFAAPDSGSAWDLEKLNQTVTQTNFILDDICSGTLISVKERLILTNHHCIDDKVKIIKDEKTLPDGTVRKFSREKREEVNVSQKSYANHQNVGQATYTGDIVGHNKKSDLAIVQLRAESIPQTVESKLRPADKPLIRGEKVYGVGNPMIRWDATVTEGVLSSLNRWIEWDDNSRTPYIQFSGGIAGGNSGGALYDNDGYLIGVPGASAGRTGHLGFAVPVETVREFLKANCFAGVYGGAEGEKSDAKCKADRARLLKKLEGSVDAGSEPEHEAPKDDGLVVPW